VFGICDMPDCGKAAVEEGWYEGGIFCGVPIDESILIRVCEEHSYLLHGGEDDKGPETEKKI